MKQLKNILLLLLVSTCTGGCKKYLDEKSDKSLVVPASVTDFQGILDDAYSMNLTSTASLPESSSDDFFLTTDYYNNNNENSRAVYTWSLKEYTFQNDWSFGYQVVYNANVCIVGIATVPQTKQNQLQWNNVKGSALFFRAFTNLNLVSEFAKAYDKGSAASDPGIVLRTGTDFNVKSVRAAVQDSYQSVINDAREAIAYLPDHPLIKLRPCKSAAYGLLARTFLSMREYDSALVYANLYLQADSVLLDYNTLDSASSTPFPRFDNPETIFYTEMNGSFVLEGTYQAFIDTTLYSSYNAADLRKHCFFYDNQGYQTYKGSYTKNPYSFFTGIATDEILLTRAECFARKDMVPAAMDDLNRLLIKRWNAATVYIPLMAANKVAALETILLERRKELLMRGLRWIDIKRLNKEGSNIVQKRVVKNVAYTLPPNDPRYALPIPIDIIRATGMAQN